MWGFWKTLAWGIPLTLTAVVFQTLGALGYLRLWRYLRPQEPISLASAVSNGAVLAASLALSAPIVILLLLWIVRLTKIPATDYLALKWPTWRDVALGIAGLVVVFGLLAVGTLVQVSLDAHSIVNGKQDIRVITAAGMASSVVVAVMVLLGISEVRKSRFAAYRWFDRALLVQVFVTEVFAFLEDQFGAAFELLFFMFLLLTLRIMIHTEVHAATVAEAPPPEPAPAGDAVVAA